MRDILDLKSASLCSCNQAKNPHFACTLAIGDEFRERTVFRGTEEKIGKRLTQRAGTNSDVGMPGRMSRSQDPNESQTSLGATTARYCRSPWATTLAWIYTERESPNAEHAK